MLQEAGSMKNTVVLILPHIQCLHLMYSEVDWEQVSSETQVQLQIMLNPDYLPDYLSVFYEYDEKNILSLITIKTNGLIITLHENEFGCHFFFSGNKFEQLWVKIGSSRIWETRTVKLLVVTIDNELKFNERVSYVCLKVIRINENK